MPRHRTGSARTAPHPRLAALQKKADSSVPVQRLAAQTQALQRYPNLNGAGTQDALIYTIIDRKTNSVIYVGQTTRDREWARFVEHVNNDSWAPWYRDYNHYDTDPYEKWRYVYKVEWKLSGVTKFETTVAEQWVMEAYKRRGAKLLNDSTPCSPDNYAKRSAYPALYNRHKLGIKASWKPTMKAK